MTKIISYLPLSLNAFMGAGFLVAVMCLMMMFDWYFHLPDLIQASSNIVDMPYHNTAIVFFLAGVGMQAVGRKPVYLAAMCGSGVLLLGGLALAGGDVVSQEGIFGILVLVSSMGLFLYQRRQLESDQHIEELRLFYDLPFIGMAITSPETRKWLVVNDYLCQMLGYSKEELFRTSWPEMVHPDHLNADLEHFQRIMQGDSEGSILDTRLIRKDGQAIHAIVHVRVIRRAKGQVDRIFVTVLDITKRKQMELVLQEEERRLREITTTLGEGLFVTDNDGKITFINPAALTLLGWREGEVLGHLSHPLFHHSYADGTPYPFTECPLCRGLTENQTITSEKELFWRRDGTNFSVAMIASPIFRDGEVRGAVVAFQDSTRQKLLEARDLRAYVNRVAISALLEVGIEPLPLRRKLEVALNIILTVPWLAVQYKGCIFLAKEEGFLEMFVQQGLHRALLHTCQRIPHGYCLCGRAAQSRKIVVSHEIDERHDVSFEGIRQHGHYCVPILLQERLLGVLNLYVDHNHPYDPEEEAFLSTIANTLAGVIERGQVDERINHAATHDPLIGLPNRTLFMELLESEIKLATRRRNQLAVGYFDLDRFKEVNDTLGHDVGDELLKAMAVRVRQCLRESDTLARMGGDEFTLILPTINDEKNALMVANKIVQALNQPFILGDQECRIGVSIGMSLFPLHGQGGEALLQKADQAMYAVKRQGRNHAAIFDSFNYS